MVQELVSYLIVALAAAWVLWSLILPLRLRAGLRRALGLPAVACGMRGRAGACCGTDCPDCPLATPKPDAAPVAAPGFRLHP